MEPLSDDELDSLLQEWRAPGAPASLEGRVRSSAGAAWWKWLLTGSVQVPVPLTLAVMAVLVLLTILALPRRPEQGMSNGLQPVKKLEVRIIRSSYEDSN